MEGTVKWYNPKNGYGFIAGDDGEDYFVHFTAIPQGVKIYPDDKVSFEAVDTEKGKQAQKVQKLGESAPAADSSEDSSEDSDVDDSDDEDLDDDSDDEDLDDDDSDEEAKEE